MQLKNELRRDLKTQRRAIKNKTLLDKKICSNLISLSEYKNADLLLFYAALTDEINVDDCIKAALNDGKKVALPVCSDDKGNMSFYYISSVCDLKSGFFGVREPDPEKCTKVKDFSSSVCIVPAIAYDRNGYRLGYGKGYYDRFLSNFSFVSVGLCYNELVKECLPTGKYDIPVKYIITEDSIISV